MPVRRWPLTRAGGRVDSLGHARECLVRRRTAAARPGCPGAGGQDHRDRSEKRFSRHRSEQSDLAAVGSSQSQCRLTMSERLVAGDWRPQLAT